MSVKFSKYQGLGNDFILINNMDSAASEINYSDSTTIRRLCDRHKGIGADGVIFVLPGSHECEYTMRFFNPDSTEAEMCGNGIRCMALFIVNEVERKSINTDRGGKTLEVEISQAHAQAHPQAYGGGERSIRIWTNAGAIVTVLLAQKTGTETEPGQRQIRVNMGKPILNPTQVPTLLRANTTDVADNGFISKKQEQDECVSEVTLQVQLPSPHTCTVSAISMGNPHCIIHIPSFVTLEEMSPSFHLLGPLIESHPTFPRHCNAGFVQVITRKHIRLWVWERGAGATLACGTGACAAVVACILADQCDDHDAHDDDEGMQNFELDNHIDKDYKSMDKERGKDKNKDKDKSRVQGDGDGKEPRGTKVSLPGGDLLIFWDHRGRCRCKIRSGAVSDHVCNSSCSSCDSESESESEIGNVYMTGPAQLVFNGVFRL